MSIRNSYAFTHPLAGVVVNSLLLAAAALLVFGLLTPVLTLEKFYWFSNTVSLYSGLQQLWQQQEWGLFLLLGGFSMLFPTLKILMLLILWNFEAVDTERHARHLRWLDIYSKWSMLDVFVVALLVVTVKLGALAEATVEPGIYAFAASVIVTMLVSSWIGHRTGVVVKNRESLADS